MKKFMLVLVVVLAMPVLVFAAEASAIPVLPGWIDGIMAMISAIPAVGPYLADAVKVAGVVAGVLTGLSAMLMGLKSILVTLNVKFQLAWLDKVVLAIENSLPYVKYLSMMNVQKK